MIFKKGDVVQHKSGGPRMVVTLVITNEYPGYIEDGFVDGDVLCEWSDPKGFFSEKAFHATSIQSYN